MMFDQVFCYSEQNFLRRKSSDTPPTQKRLPHSVKLTSPQISEQSWLAIFILFQFHPKTYSESSGLISYFQAPTGATGQASSQSERCDGGTWT